MQTLTPTVKKNILKNYIIFIIYVIAALALLGRYVNA